MIRTLKWIALLIAQGYLAFLYTHGQMIDFMPRFGFEQNIPAEVMQNLNFNLVGTALALVVVSILFDIILLQKKRIFGYLWQLVMLILVGSLVYFIFLQIG